MTQQLKPAHGQQVSGALDSAGNFFPLDSCQISKVSDSSGALLYTLAEYGGNTWKKTVSRVAEGAGTREVSGFWVKLGPPAAPTISTVVAGNKQATITFAHSSNDGGYPITSDRIFAYDATTNDLIGYQDGASPLVFTGLTNDTAIYFVAASINSAGVGAHSAASSTVTPVGSSSSTSPLVNGTPINAMPL